MRIDASEALAHPGRRQPVRFEAGLEAEALSGERVEFGPAEFIGELIGAGDSVRVEGAIRCVARSRCAKCLGEAEAELSAGVIERFAKGAEEGGDAYPLDGSRLDMGPMIREALILALPMRFLCGAGCRGLCPDCGADLNTGPCACAAGDTGG